MKVNWGIIADVFSGVFSAFFVVLVAVASYFFGFKSGEFFAITKLREEMSLLNEKVSYKEIQKPTPVPKTVDTTPPPISKPRTLNWTGPQLWEEVNRARVEHGVGSLKQKDELCTIASIRLNELLELGKLDGHQGFSTLPDRRPDLKWIYEKYTIAEFLISGAVSAKDAVESWLNTLGHSKLLTGGEYVWGCTYAQNGFGVAIAAY